ncbi:MAG TPA: DUF6600 domain-containing protein [Variovorax sp.]|nr:DUF6600 domain-containing protein [Variovorax sp.]
MTTLRALLRCLVLLLAAGLALQAAAQDSDPPGRVAYLNSQQGALSMSPAGDDSWYDTIPNRPMTQGDRIWADGNARAELYVGDTALRMGGQTHLAIDELNDQALRVTVQQGRLQLRVRSELEGQRIELGTGNLSMVVRAPGDYRVLVDQQNDTTQIMVAQGSVTVYGENGQVQELGNRQQAVYTGRELASGGAPQALASDFEQWLAARNRAEEQSKSARYISREVPGYQQLDQYGEWQNVPEYGAVWYPSQVDPGWAPYSDGYWVTVAPWGLTWVDRAPWGFAPFHYGRWTRVGGRWCWVPGHRHVRPVYSPALVAFVGGAPGANFTARGGRPAVGWFPLAPGDRWRPGYRASDRYIERANRMAMATRDAPAYANRALPNAVTAVPADRFGRGSPISRRDHVRPPDPRVLNQARVLDRPPVPMAGLTGPGRAAGGMDFAGRRSSAVPPEAIQARQQPDWRQRFGEGQRDQARSQERAGREQQDVQRRALQEQQQVQRQQQEQSRRQAEQQQENMQRQAGQQEQQRRREAEQQEQQSRRQMEQQGQQQEQARRQGEQRQQQQEQSRRQAEQQPERAERQAEQQAQQMQMQQRQEQARRQGEQQQEQARRQAEQQQQSQRAAQMQVQQQQEQGRRQAEQQQERAQRQAEQQAQQMQMQQRQERARRQGEQQQEQARRQAEQQQQQSQRAAQMQAQQQQEQARRQAEQQQAHQQRQAEQQQAQRAAQMQAQQQQEQARRQMEQQQAHAQRQAQQQQEQSRRQAEQQQAHAQRQAEQAARQQQQQVQQQAEQQARQREQQQRQQQQQQAQGGQRQRGNGQPGDQQQRP